MTSRPERLTEPTVFLRELHEVIEQGIPPEIFSFMEQNMVSLFSTPDIPRHYKALKPVDFLASQRTYPKVMMAWLAFLSGDHANMSALMSVITEPELRGAEEKSLFYGLKALVSGMTCSEEGLRYAKLSLDVLPVERKTFILGNAYLTYAQLLAGVHRYRAAADMFALSHGIFLSLGSDFLAVIALANESLNRYKLGEIAYVLDKCSQALLMSSNFTERSKSYWNILNLPLGMCYYELTKPHLAVEHLVAAQETIDELGMFHLHGLIEMYLFRSYYAVNDNANMERVFVDILAKFQKMHFKHTDFLISLFRIISLDKDTSKLRADAERLEMEFAREGINCDPLVMEALTILKLRGISDAITIEDLEKRLDKLRYLGEIPQVQLTILQLAELHFNEHRQQVATNYLKVAVENYKEHGCGAAFYSLDPQLVNLLPELAPALYHFLRHIRGVAAEERVPSLLSAREKEVMQLVALGKSNEEIGKALFIGVGTTKWHLNNIFGKLGVKNRTQAVERATHLGEVT